MITFQKETLLFSHLIRHPRRKMRRHTAYSKPRTNERLRDSFEASVRGPLQFVNQKLYLFYKSHLLQHAKLVNTWVGLRPGREEVRIEAEERDGRLYIHNYGHGEYIIKLP